MNNNRDILLIEDEQVVAGAARRILISEKYHVDIAETAEAGLEKLKTGSYNLILSDLMLPGMSGIDFLSEAGKIREDIPVIIITGYASLKNAIKSFKTGAFDFIPKPFDFEELAAVVYRATASLDLSEQRHHDRLEGEIYSLGMHSWARLDKERMFTIGVGSTIATCMGTINSVELPAINDEISQGNLCARIVSQGYLNHMVWAPLSGKVVSINEQADKDPAIIDRTPYSEGWLMKIIPTNLEKDIENLTRLQSQ
ncbi:MAG: response regulator [candidate division KSB1 bacterium]|jgi:CheY-like chemotaxis protein|nr:response regulator [candidate division KSB1 bacterium]